MCPFDCIVLFWIGEQAIIIIEMAMRVCTSAVVNYIDWRHVQITSKWCASSGIYDATNFKHKSSLHLYAFNARDDNDKTCQSFYDTIFIDSFDDKIDPIRNYAVIIFVIAKWRSHTHDLWNDSENPLLHTVIRFHENQDVREIAWATE